MNFGSMSCQRNLTRFRHNNVWDLISKSSHVSDRKKWIDEKSNITWYMTRLAAQVCTLSQLYQMDVKSAFLNENFNEEVYWYNLKVLRFPFILTMFTG